MFQKPRRGRQARNFTKKVPKILDLKSSSEQIFSENWRWVPLTNHFQSSNKPNIGELNDFALFRYSRVLWSNGHGKAFVRQLGAFNSEGRLLQTVCGKSFNLRPEPGLYLYWKGASTRSCISFDVSVSIVKHINDDLLYFDQCTNFMSSWPFRTVLRLDDKLRVTDILKEYKSRVEDG